MEQNYPKFRLIAGLVTFLTLCIFAGCSKNGSNPTPKNTGPTLAITSLSVNTGPYNTSVTITGTGFSTTIPDDQVFFNGKAAIVTATSTTQLTAAVPLGAGTGPISVSVKNGASVSGPVFTYELAAVVTTLVSQTNAAFNVAWGVVADATGNLYVSDKNNFVIRKVSSGGAVTTLAGSGTYGSSDGTGIKASFSEPLGLTFDNQGNLLVADFVTNLIRKITPLGVVTTLQVTSNQTGFTPPIFTPTGVAVDVNNNIYVSNFWNITKLAPNGTATLFEGGSQSGFMDGGPGVATLSIPLGLKTDQNGNFFFADVNAVRTIDKNGIVTTIAGVGPTTGYQDGKGSAARFNYPTDVAVDNSGSIYVTDQPNCVIRKVANDGTVTTFAGNVNTHNSVDGVGSNAGFSAPTGICIDSRGTIYVTDGSEIRKIVFE